MIKKIIFTFIIFCSELVYASHYTIIVGFPIGGGQHAVAQILEKSFERQNLKTIILNKPGVSGIIALNECIQQADPSTLCLVSQAQLMPLDSNSKTIMKYDLENLNFIKLIGESPNVLLANKNNTKSLDQIIENIKNDKVSMASGTNGLNFFTNKLLIEFKAKQSVNVNYQGVGPALVDLIGNHIDYMIAPYSAVKQHITSNSVKVVANLDKNIIIQGVPNLTSFSTEPTRFGIVASGRLSNSEILNQESLLTKFLEDKNVRQELKDLGIIVPSVHLSGIDYKKISINEKTKYQIQ